jgi:formiminotetrahydrofolate cyclodeaminase
MDAPSSITSSGVDRLLDRLASRQPTPGGGSAAALAGALAAALVEMVSALSVGRGESEAEAKQLRDIGVAAGARRRELLELAQADADAYGAVVSARRLPHDQPAQRAQRSARVAEATREAARVPLTAAESASSVLDLAALITPIGNRHAVSDAGVAALLAAAAVRGAVLNVRINLPGIAADDPFRPRAVARAAELWESASRGDDVAAEVDRLIGDDR